MLSKHIGWTMLLAVLLILASPVTQAQSTDPTGDPEQQQETQAFAQGGGFLEALERMKTAIAGTWLTTLASTGSKGLITFTADGTAIFSTQGEVSAAPNRPPHTSLHGVWRHLGGRQFGYTVWDIWYDINTAQLVQFARIRAEVTLNENGAVCLGAALVRLAWLTFNFPTAAQNLRAATATRRNSLSRTRRLCLASARDKALGEARQRFHIAPLPFGRNRVKGQQRLARTAQAGDDDEPFAQDCSPGAFEVVCACAMDGASGTASRPRRSVLRQM
jgi:hypothetical protein